MITWNDFEQTSKNFATDFEDLSRLFFKICFLGDVSICLGKKVNNAGIETDPVSINGIRIGFQAKYFHDRIAYKDIADSFQKTIKYYAGKVDRIILFCNKDIDQTAKSFVNAVALLTTNQIQLELYCNQSILDPIIADEKYAKIKTLFFNKHSLTLGWFKDRLAHSLSDLEPRYKTGFHVNNDELQQFFGVVYQDESIIYYLRRIIKGAKHELAQIKGYNDIVQSVTEIIGHFTVPDRTQYTSIFGWHNSLNSIKTKIIKLEDELNKQYESSFGEDSTVTENERKQLSLSLTNCRRLHDVVERFNFAQDAFLKNLNSNIYIVEGDAGSGKSHFLGYEADIHGTSEEYRTVLLLGQQFIFDNKPQDQIKSILGLQCSFEDFILACEAKGEIDGGITVIMIDAINECSRYDIWKQYLNELIRDITKLKYVRLVLAIRTTYKEYIFPDQFVDSIKKGIVPTISICGFRNNLLDAIPIFFNYYNIPLTTSAYFEMEFENPLFLKIYCESYTNGVVIGSRGIFSLYNDFLKKEEQKVRNQLNITTSISYANEIIKVIGKYLYENRTLYIPLTKLYANCGNIPKCDLFVDAFLRAKVLVQYKYDDDDRVFINYERFTDYIVAKHILDSTHSFAQLCNKIKREMLIVDSYGNLPHYMEGRFAALSLLAREKYNKEIIRCLDSISSTDSFGRYLLSGIVTEYLDTYKYRADKDIDAEDFKKEIIHYLQSKQTEGKFLDTLIGLSGRNCSLNANALTSLLFPMRLSHRDYFWTLYINQEYSQGSRIYNIVQYFLNCDIKIITHQDRILYGQLLTWFLSSSNRKLRDCSSRALVHLLCDDIATWIEILKIFENINDPYIISRLYGCIYGALLLTSEDKLDLNELSKLCCYIKKIIFEKEIVYPDILLRDYALNILEYCVTKKYVTNLVIQNYRPPYKSYLIPDIKCEELKVIYPKSSPDKWLGTTAIMASMAPNYNLDGFASVYMYGDFGRYIFQSSLSYFKDVDIIKTFYYAYYYIVKHLGYDNKLFSEFDKFVGYGRVRNDAFIERIGKKYEWIAMYHILALISDQYSLKNYNDSISPYKGPWEPYLRDFDPTLTLMSSERMYNIPSISLTRPVYNNWNLKDEHWAHLEDAWNFIDNITIVDENGERWHALDFYVSDELGKDFNKPRQTVWLMGTACLIKKTERDAFIDKIQSKSLYGRWLNAAEVDSSYSVFLREHAWATSYQEEYQNLFFREVDIQTGERVVKKRMPRVTFNLNGDGTNGNSYITINDYGDESEIEESVTEVIGRIMPCSREYLWEQEYDCSKKEAVHIRMPHKFLIDTLKLKQVKDGLWHNDKELVCADFSLHIGSNVKGLYIREKYLYELLADDLSIIWICIGEKQHLLGDPATGQQIWSELSSLVHINDNGELKEIRKIEQKSYKR
mgnify:FL=1